MASALPATSGTTPDAEEAVDDDDSPWALVADAATAAAADTAAGPEEDRAHVATAEASRVRAFIFAREMNVMLVVGARQGRRSYYCLVMRSSSKARGGSALSENFEYLSSLRARRNRFFYNMDCEL